MRHYRNRSAGRGVRETRYAGTMQGKLRIARNGAGYLIDPETDNAVWIEQADLGTALPGDTVTVGLRKKDSGVVTSIDERAPRSVVGTVTGIGRIVRVQPLNPAYRQEFIVPDAHGAEVGERVVMKLVRWENPRLAPEGEITDVIGPADNPSLDTLSILKQYDLPEEFPGRVVAAAERVAEKLSEPGERLDLRDKFIFTCDPASARDFDDALSLETDRKGNRILGVHIADVSHFVTPGSVLDKEAYKRSTSVYLVDKVVPMLPEQLSNGVCSLVPHEDRLAFSAILTFDKYGNCTGRKFAKTIINSKARFNYEEVMDVISGKRVKLEGKAVKAAWRKTIVEIHKLAQQLKQNRFAAGALDMDVPEAEIQLDGDGMMSGIVMRPYDESHQMVEECMVAANEAVAQELWTRGVKILARLHEAPDGEKLEELRENLGMLGISTGDLSRQGAIAQLLKKIKGSPLESVISVMVLKSMKRAVYSAQDIGHFGLAKKYYAHFTSPIRRYPDLTLHRQLSAWLAGKGGKADKSWLNRAALHTSECEQTADEAERALAEIKKYRYLQAQLDAGRPEPYEAVVAKCTRYGVFVDLPDLALGGMIHVSRLSDTYLRWDDFSQTLSGGGKTWQTGMRLEVIVDRVDFDQRKIDFAPSGAPTGGGGRRERREEREDREDRGEERGDRGRRGRGGKRREHGGGGHGRRGRGGRH